MTWVNLYGSAVLGVGDTIFVRYGNNFADIAYPMCGPCFRRFMRVYKLRMVIIKKRYFGVTSKMFKALLMG